MWDTLLPTEVASCLHPVRFYQPPDTPAFACVYSRALPAGAPVALYAGVVRREDNTERWRSSDVYTWDLENDTHCIINAAERGGMARFINAHLYRSGGLDTVNCEATAALDEDLLMPTVALHTTRCVEELSEAVCDYGNRYWPTIKDKMLDAWSAYMEMARWLHALMAESCAASGLEPARLPVPLPAHQDDSYHWAPDEVAYPKWPVGDIRYTEDRTVRAPIKPGKFRPPSKRVSKI